MKVGTSKLVWNGDGSSAEVALTCPGGILVRSDGHDTCICIVLDSSILGCLVDEGAVPYSDEILLDWKSGEWG